MPRGPRPTQMSHSEATDSSASLSGGSRNHQCTEEPEMVMGSSALGLKAENEVDDSFSALSRPSLKEEAKTGKAALPCTGGVVCTATTTGSEGTLSESERRREQTLFLGDSEQFAFDFGGAAIDISETVAEDDAAQRATQRAEELRDATARLCAAAASNSAAVTRSLTLEEVNAYAADAMAQGPKSFLTLPKSGSRKRAASPHADAISDDHLRTNPPPSRKEQEGVDEGATLAEAIPQFRLALRRYEAGLWRMHKQRREEGEERQRSKHKPTQRV